MFLEKFPIYAVVSTQKLLDDANVTVRIEQWFTSMNLAEQHVKKLDTWRNCAIITQQVDLNDLARILNEKLG